MCEQAMSGAKIDDAAAAKHPPDASRHLPGFVQFFPRQAARMTHGARDAIKQRFTGKPFDVVIGQPAFRRMRKRHAMAALVLPNSEDPTAIQ